MSETTRTRWLLRAALAALAIAGGLTLLLLDPPRKISTDVLDLMPAAERAPELSLVRTLANENQSRVALFALRMPDASDAERDRAAARFSEALRQQPAFDDALPLMDEGVRTALARHLHARRLELLFPGWLAARQREFAGGNATAPFAAWLAETAAVRLEAYLARPEAVGFQEVLPGDPLLLLPSLAESASEWTAGPAPPGDVRLVWARTSAAPLRAEGQTPVFAAVESARAATQSVVPQLQLEWTAVARFAATSRARIEREMSLLNTLSVAAVLAVAVLGLRRARNVLHLAPVIGGGLLGAWVVTLATFERTHVLVFVIGSLLSGVAIDYGFYLFLQPPRTGGEPYRARARRLLKPLLASALTTVLGFCLLLFSELPLLRQLGVFVSAGLLSALGTALLWFGQLREPFAETRAFARLRPRESAQTRTAARVLLLILAAAAVAGATRVNWKDDIRDLEVPAPELWAEATKVRGLFGETSDRAIYLTSGTTFAEARLALERLREWQTAQAPDAPLVSLALALPTAAQHREAREFAERNPGFPRLLAEALERHGFDATEFAPFVTAWESWVHAAAQPYEDEIAALTEALRGPLSLVVSRSSDRYLLTSAAVRTPATEPPPETASATVRQLETLNRLFARYRTAAVQLSLFGLGLLALSVLVIYGMRHGGRVFAVPAGSCLVAFGLLGLGGQPLNLFHLLGGFLGVCLSHNYAIFSAENALRRETPPPSIRLSGITTAASFIVLGFSRIPAVSGLGWTVALIVLAALALIELEPLARRSRPSPPSHLP